MRHPDKIELEAVFWDYPEFRDQNHLRQYLKNKNGKSGYFWVMNRFLEYARVVDTFSVFDIHEIAESLSKLKLSVHALKKWKRMVEVYG